MPTPTCPTCGAPSVRIAYGFPGPKLIEDMRAGRAVAGGCVLYDGRPMWQCTGADRHRFGRHDDAQPETPLPQP